MTAESNDPQPSPAVEQELAGVVIASESQAQAGRPWSIILRPWLFCLLFLAVAEIGTRIYFDGTLCLRGERFDNFANAATEDVWVDQIRRDKAFRVVVIGDSTVVGASLLKKNETIPRFLERRLQEMVPGHEIHVWNLSLAGARSTDQLCMLLKALEAKPDFVIVTANHIMFSQNVQLMPLAQPWLARNLNPAPAVIRPLLPHRGYKEMIDDTVTGFVERSSRLVGARQAINAMLFGVQPRAPVDTPNPAVMAAAGFGKWRHMAAMKPWRERTSDINQWRGQYAVPVTPDNFNGKYYKYIFEALRRGRIPAISYLTPQNPAFTSAFLSKEQYAENRRVINGFFKDSGFPHYDLSDLIPDGLFYDNDHLLATGNRILAEELSGHLLVNTHSDIASRRGKLRL